MIFYKVKYTACKFKYNLCVGPLGPLQYVGQADDTQCSTRKFSITFKDGKVLFNPIFFGTCKCNPWRKGLIK